MRSMEVDRAGAKRHTYTRRQPPPQAHFGKSFACVKVAHRGGRRWELASCFKTVGWIVLQMGDDGW